MNFAYKHTNVKESDYTLNCILKIILEGTWDWNANTGSVHRSPSWYTMLGYENDTFLQDVFTWENIIHPDDYPLVMKHFELYISGKINNYEIEYRCKKADGSYLWITDRGMIVEYNEDESVARMIGAHHNIHLQKMAQNDLIQKNQLLQEGNLSLEKLLKEKNVELEKKNIELENKIKEVEYLSVTDALTQIANRRKFEIEIEKEIARSLRYRHNLSFVIFDIDLFKNVNDTYGHNVGDEVLKKLSLTVKKELRINDFICRWGGEEFALLLPETDLHSAIEICEKLRQIIMQIDFDNGIFITCSFGVAEFNLAQTKNELFTNADEALYKAKELGRNRIEYKD